MVAKRDLVVANDIAEMAALGWFPHEFIVYGCCYIENGIMYYKVSENDTVLYHFKEESLKCNVYVSPIVELLNRVLIPSGMQDEYMMRTKIQLAKQLQQDYPVSMMSCFALLAEREGNDSAAKLLYELKRKLTGCFEREVLMLVESIIEYAFQQKKLKLDTYTELKQWMSYIYRQLEDEMVPYRRFKRTFYGFAYKTDTGDVKYFVNASESEARKRKEVLYIKGIQTTPILQKKYSFSLQPNLSEVKKEFQNQLERWLDTEYWWYIETINAMPTVIAGNEYENLYQLAKDTPMVQQHMQYYQTQWGIK